LASIKLLICSRLCDAVEREALTFAYSGEGEYPFCFQREQLIVPALG
jgi:hypothetical protein